MRNVYLAGPMRGIPQFNFPAFDRAQGELERAGYHVFSPAQCDRIDQGFDPVGMTGNEDLSKSGFDLRYALKSDTAWICTHADAVVLLPGWQRSTGAQAELALAKALVIPGFELEDFLALGEGAPDVTRDSIARRLRPGGYVGRGPRPGRATDLDEATGQIPPDVDEVRPTRTVLERCVDRARAVEAGETWDDFLERTGKAIAEVAPMRLHSGGIVSGPTIERVPDSPAVDFRVHRDGVVVSSDDPTEVGRPSLDVKAPYGEVRVVDPNTGGEKGQKPAQLGAIDPQSLLVLGEVAGFGATKYARYNYLKGYAWSLSADACLRHLLQFLAGEDLDEESGLPHAAHVAWHGLALTSFLLRGIGTDDRAPAEGAVTS